MNKLLRIGGILALVFAAAVYPVIGGIASGAVEAYLIPAKDPALVEQEKILFDPAGMDRKSPQYRKAVISLYGLPTDETTALVFVPAEKYVRPSELPEITILPIDKEKGENPMQVKTLWFFAKYLAGGAALTGVALLGLSTLFAKKKSPAPAA